MSLEQWKVFFEKLSTPFYREFVLRGLFITLKIAALGFILGVALGTLLALVQVTYSKNCFIKVLDKICKAYVALFRGTPMVVQLLLAYYVLIPLMAINNVNSETVGIIVFGMNSAAYVSEIMRGGINSVDVGQLEAGRALGLSYTTTMAKIVIPQAFKNILPTLGNELITLVKETSVLSFIVVSDLYTSLKTLGKEIYNLKPPYIFMAAIYIIIVLIITLIIRSIEKALSKSDRKHENTASKKAVKKHD